MFLGLGLSGIIPTLHYVISEGFLKAATIGQIGWLMLMAGLYITGAALYAARIPERFFPGKCDIWVSMIGAVSVHTHVSVSRSLAGWEVKQLTKVKAQPLPHQLSPLDGKREYN